MKTRLDDFHTFTNHFFRGKRCSLLSPPFSSPSGPHALLTPRTIELPTLRLHLRPFQQWTPADIWKWKTRLSCVVLVKERGVGWSGSKSPTYKESFFYLSWRNRNSVDCRYIDDLLLFQRRKSSFEKMHYSNGFLWALKTTNMIGSFIEITRVKLWGKTNIVIPVRENIKGQKDFKCFF